MGIKRFRSICALLKRFCDSDTFKGTSGYVIVVEMTNDPEDSEHTGRKLLLFD